MPKQPKIQFWHGASGLWYIQVRAANGEIVLDGAQGYSTKASCKRAVKRIKNIVSDAVVIDEPLEIPFPS